MARLLVSTAVGAAVGYLTASPQAGFAAFSAAYGATGFLDPAQQVKGPRLDDLKGTTAEYGTAIPVVYGHPRIAGAIVWCSDKQEVSHTEDAGGKGGPSTETTTYTYKIDVRILLTANLIGGVRKVWSNGKLIWSIAEDADEETIAASQETDAWERITVYTGASDQMPDPVEEAALGIENCPAYRGRGSVFIEGLNLGGSGYLPNLTFEIASSGGGTFEPVIFEYTGAAQEWVCPEGVTAVQVRAWGGGGAGGAVVGAAGAGGAGGGAGYVRGLVSVTPGETYSVIVGGGGTYVGVKGFGGGGDGSTSGSIPGGVYRTGGGGGGRSALVGASIDLITAAGGGGGGAGNGSENGGAGGGEAGGAGAGGAGGGGGTQSAGGAGGSPSSGSNGAIGQAGYSQHGGDGDASVPPVDSSNGAGGGGGGGYYGGGGGGASNSAAGGGGGGSSFGSYTEAGSGQAPGGADDDYYDGNGVAGASTQNGTHGRLVLLPAGTAGISCRPLDEVLEDLCVRSGIDASYVDFSSCAGQEVCALAVSQVTPAKTVAEMLGSTFLQEFVESGAGLKTVARGGASVATLAYDKLGASQGDPVEPLPLKRLNDIEIPRQFAVTYSNLLNDYQKGTEYSDRLLGGSTSVATVELPLGLEPQQAKRLADVKLMDAVAGIIQVGPVGVTREFARLEPTDVITLTDHTGSTFRVRILKITDHGGLRTLECVMDDASAVNSEAVTNEDYETSTVVRRVGDTEMIPIDGPLARDVDDKPGYMVAFGASSAYRWPGAGFYDSVDGSTFTKLYDVTDRARYGTATTALADFAGGNVFDDASTVRVEVNGTLSSATRDALIADIATNALLIGADGRWEALQYQTATLVSEGVYDLSGLLRGRLGTEHAMGSHEAGDQVIKLQATGLRSIDQQAADIGILRYIKAVTFGKSFGAVTAEEFTPQSVRLKPLAPVDLRCSRNGSGGFHITWARRSRLASQIFGTVPLGEATEAYEVDILDGADVVRTISVTSEAADYNATQQSADFGSVQTSIDVAVYQLSATVGRGYPLTGTLSTSYTPVGQSNTITLAGTFAAGVPISVYANGSLIGSRTSVGGDTNLAGIATGLAAVINAHASYAASAVGSVITVTGNPGAVYTLTANVGGSSAISVVKTQDAALANDGLSYESQLYVANLATGVTDPVDSGVTLSVTVKRNGVTVSSFSYTTTASMSKVSALSGLISEFADNSTLIGLGYSMSLGSTTGGGDFARFNGPVGDEGISLTTSGSAPWALSVSVQREGSAAVPEDLAQIVDVTVTGTPANGEVFRVTLDGTPFDYTATVPTDTREEVIDGLVAAIDADADLTAAQLSSTKLEASATFIGEFSYSARITRGITATVA